ncbi:MAG: hypothetical protein Q8Q49_03755 [bacterium]|nr:hypothetical protein [bacterium]
MNKKLFAGAFFLCISLFATKAVEASGIQYGGCPTQYGSGNACPSQEISVDKTVQIPGSKTYVDNLTINDAKFSANSTVSFRIVIKNTGSDTIENLNAEDTLPEQIDFVSGSGKFDKNSRKLSFTIDKLHPDEEKLYVIQAKVVADEKLPQDQGVTCAANQVSVKFKDRTVIDTSQFCIVKEMIPGETKGGLKVFPSPQSKSTPPTGPEALALIALLPGGIGGFLLRRKASR